MSTTVEPVDPEGLKEALAAVRSDQSGTDRKSWLLVGHANNVPNSIELVAHDPSAEANIGDFSDKLEDDRVMYGLIRLSTPIDMSNTVRFIYVHWLVATFLVFFIY